jgi:sigma-E factor negative regulatory protein RseA
MLMHHTHATNSAPDAPNLHEQLSALMDGECSSQETAELSHALAGSKEWQQTWHDFEAVGCALRAHAQGVTAPLLTPHSAFVQGVMDRVRAEQAPAFAIDQATARVQETRLHTAANDGLFRWKLVASVATMAAVVSVAWQVGDYAAPNRQQIAAAPAPTEQTTVASVAAWQQVQTPQGTMLRDPELEALMAAHRQYGGMTALQMPAGFLRTATFDSSVQ